MLARASSLIGYEVFNALLFRPRNITLTLSLADGKSKRQDPEWLSNADSLAKIFLNIVLADLVLCLDDLHNRLAYYLKFCRRL